MMDMLLDQPNMCVHCGKKFALPRTLISHICEAKRRAMQETEKRVQAGFVVFNRFWQLTQNAKKPKSYAEFSKSPYYNSFVKFGSFVNNVKPLYTDRYIDFVIKSGVKLDFWCSDELYNRYLFDMIKIEPVDSAVQRSLETMMIWGDKHNLDFVKYFELASLSHAVHEILDGKLSPWVVLNNSSGQQMINNMSDEQLNLISPALDIQFWSKKFRDNPADVLLVKEICKEINIK